MQGADFFGCGPVQLLVADSEDWDYDFFVASFAVVSLQNGAFWLQRAGKVILN